MKQKSISEIAHNPLNIRVTNDVWRGQVGQYKGFVRFINDIFGYRAAFKIILGYMGDGLITPRAIISKWAPETENDVMAYLSTVCKPTISTLREDEPISSMRQLRELVYLMTLVERGSAGDFGRINSGYALALSSLSKKQAKGIKNITNQEFTQTLNNV